MKEFNQYMEQFKENSLEEKKEIALEQLKIITGLTNAMCIELGCANEMIITKDVLEGQKNKESEEDFVESVVVYASSIQTSLCDLVDKITEILENKENK